MYAYNRDFSVLKENNLINILRQRAIYQPSQTAYTFLLNGGTEAVSLTYKELDQKARFIGSLLQNLGLTGERALLMYPPGLEFITTFFGCLYAGVIAVPAYPPRRNQSLDRLSAIVADCQAKEVLTTTSVWKSLEHGLEQYPELMSLRWLATDNLVNNLANTDEFSDLDTDTLAFLQYTSGSTGTPKGVMVTHGNIIHNLFQIHQSFGHSPRSQGVIWLPLYHDMGLIGGVLEPLYSGFPVALMSPIDFLQKPLRWLETISHYGGTTSGGPNFAYDLCVRKITEEQVQTLDLSSWEVAFTGAEPVRADTIEQFAEKFAPCGFRKEAFYPCYGMAEATLFISGGSKSQAPAVTTVAEEALEENQVIPVAVHHPEVKTKTFVSCGKAWDDQKILIVDPDTLTACQAQQIGEIWVSGSSVTKGYWYQPQRTQETFQAYCADNQEGPYLRTGDLGFIGEDGELFITGRIKDVIIIRGRNHYPQDIEQTVKLSHTALSTGYGAAFSVDVDGEERLVIVQEVDRHHLRKIDTQEVIADIRQTVVAKHGLQVHSVVLIKPSSIPKTSSGKIQRYLCRAKFLAGTLDQLVTKKSASLVLGKELIDLTD